MNQLFINVVGHNSAGKTYLSKKLAKDISFERVNGDDFRLFVYKSFHYFANEKLGKKSHRNDQLNQFIVEYRIKMIELLLEAGQNVILDGSGATKEWRARYLNRLSRNFPQVKRIILYAKIDEPDLLQRLSARDKDSDEEIWETHYNELKKDLFEPPAAGESDYLLVYTQNNYDEIRQKITQILNS